MRALGEIGKLCDGCSSAVPKSGHVTQADINGYLRQAVLGSDASAATESLRSGNLSPFPGCGSDIYVSSKK